MLRIILFLSPLICHYTMSRYTYYLLLFYTRLSIVQLYFYGFLRARQVITVKSSFVTLYSLYRICIYAYMHALKCNFIITRVIIMWWDIIIKLSGRKQFFFLVSTVSRIFCLIYIYIFYRILLIGLNCRKSN